MVLQGRWYCKMCFVGTWCADSDRSQPHPVCSLEEQECMHLLGCKDMPLHRSHLLHDLACETRDLCNQQGSLVGFLGSWQWVQHRWRAEAEQWAGVATTDRGYWLHIGETDQRLLCSVGSLLSLALWVTVHTNSACTGINICCKFMKLLY